MAIALRLFSVCLTCAALGLSASAKAQPLRDRAGCAVVLLRAPDSDPLEFARAANRCGDGDILDWLASDETSAAQLAAIRASPYLVAPERALTRLVALLSSRDSLLAPAAARAALAIAGSLGPDRLAARESAPGELSAARIALHRASENPQLRGELRMMAARAAALLEAAGVPSA